MYQDQPHFVWRMSLEMQLSKYPQVFSLLRSWSFSPCASLSCSQPKQLVDCQTNHDGRINDRKTWLVIGSTWLSESKVGFTSYLLHFSSHIKKFIINNLNNFKWLWWSYGIYKNIAVNVHGILCREDGVFILTSCVHHLNFILLAVDSGWFGERW